jgi:hypothetical protein
MRRLVAAIVLGFAAVMPANAYNEAGHFYSVGYAVRNLTQPMPANWAAIIAFCAQLPDECYELDAVEQGRSLAPWHPVNISHWWLSIGDGSDVQRMIAVQQLLHGLTGGEAKALQASAVEIVKELAKPVTSHDGGTPTSDQLCALGFAYHLLGDSFAHEAMDAPQAGQQSRMYETGYGHVRDGHNPDYPLYDLTGVHTRWDAWSRYTTEGAGYAGTFDGGLVRALATGIAGEATKLSCWFGLRSGPACLDDYGDTIIEANIRKKTDALQCLAPAVEDHGYDACDAYMKTSLARETTCLPSCRGAWDIYKKVAADELTKNEKARDPVYGSLKAADYADPDLSYPDPRVDPVACAADPAKPENGGHCPYPNRTPAR